MENLLSSGTAPGLEKRAIADPRRLSPKSRASRPLAGWEISRTPTTGPSLLSYLQDGIWYWDKLAPNTPLYNFAEGLHLRGQVNKDILQRSLNLVIARHESLRTNITDREGVPVAVISRDRSLRIEEVDLCETSGPGPNEFVRRLAEQEARRPFDLSRDLLIRAKLLRLGAAEHVLVLTVHHIVFDLWSLGVLYRELSELYQSFSEGRHPELPELPIQYSDFAAWQRQQLRGERLEKLTSYWTEALGGQPEFQHLMLDHPRSAHPTYGARRETASIPAHLASKLGQLSRHERTTQFMILAAAFQVLLRRYSGHDHISIGFPAALRERQEVSNLIGYFVNTLVLKCNLSGNPTFTEVLRRVRETSLNAYRHQDLPFEKVVSLMSPERSFRHTSLFQVMFVARNAPDAVLRLPGLDITRFEPDTAAAKFDLTVWVDAGEDLGITFEYDKELFDAATIKRMMGHYLNLLAAVAENPELCISNIPLLAPSERHQILVEWNQTRCPYPQSTVHELFEQQAESAPDAIALAEGNQQLTYAELNRRANLLADQLKGRGVGPEIKVGICMKRSLELVIGLLGTLKAGGAYVPIDSAFPQERVAFMLQDADVRLILTETSLAPRLPSRGIDTLYLDGFSSGSLHAVVNPDSGTTPDNLAYVIYTSGSTGQPKGVNICHRSVVNFLTSMRTLPGIRADDTLLSVTTSSFDIFGLEIWLPLTTGAKVVIAPEEVVRDGKALAELVRRGGATIMQATPSTWRLLLESGWEGNLHLKILCGGETMPVNLAEQLLPKCAALWNMYGPTETTIWSSVHAVEKGKPIMVGRPIANTRFYVVDRNLQPVPVGVPGELLIGGDGLARGYCHRPELTAKAFIADHFCPDGESRLYRTGDLVRYRANGAVEYLGRMDQQVKVRGFRIELGEIESVLRTHSAVQDAVVVARNDEETQRLVAYFVPSAEWDGGPAVLRDYLKAKLPGYMVPASFVKLEKLPLAPNGKIDRKALPSPDSQTGENRASDAPRDVLEQQLTHLWRKILGVRQIGRSDDFFDLGGHSLAAAQMFSGIERLTGKSLPLATLYRASTVGQLADILRNDGWFPNWLALVPINAGGSRVPLYLVHGAEGNVLLYRQLARRLGPEQPVYGLQSLGLNGGRPHASVEEMASHYVQEVVNLQPVGPYCLGGYCLGGTIAFEMAQQLQAQGRQVGLVAMLEAYNERMAAQSNLPGMSLLNWLQNVCFHGANLYLLPGESRPKFLREKWDTALRRAGIRLHTLCHALKSGRGGDCHYPHLKVKRTNDLAAVKYVPRAYSGRVVVIRPKSSFLGLGDPSFGWSEVVPNGLEIREIPVYPKGMLVEPFVQMLAQELSACISQVESR
jgi:amino acid adenylation domain-containing protein